MFRWKNFEKYQIFCTLPWSRWNRTYKLWITRVVPFAIAELGQKCLEAAPTLKYEPLNICITVLSVWILKMFQCCASKHLSRNKRQKNCEESRWQSQSALVWPLAQQCHVSTFNFLGPCNRHPHIQSHKDT